MCFQRRSVRKEMEKLLWMLNDTRSCLLLIKSHCANIILLKDVLSNAGEPPNQHHSITSSILNILCAFKACFHTCMRSESGSEPKHLSVPFSVHQASRMLNAAGLQPWPSQNAATKLYLTQVGGITEHLMGGTQAAQSGTEQLKAHFRYAHFPDDVSL